MSTTRRHRCLLLAGTPLLLLASLGGCGRQEDEGTTLHDVTPEGGPSSQTRNGQARGSNAGNGAFSSFQSRITERPSSFPSISGIFGRSESGDTLRDVADGGGAPPARNGAPVAPSEPMVPPPPTMQSPPPIVPPPAVVVPADTPQVMPVRGMTQVASAPVSTFSVDVDTASYARARSAILAGRTPDPSSVRIEEMVNYFRYDLPRPADASRPFSVLTDVVRSPWHPDSLVVRVGLRGYEVPDARRLPANLVFLVDVSGSMDPDDRLPLVKRALTSLVDELGPRDRVSLVVYAGSAQVVLSPTADKAAIRAAVDGLSAGGSTAGGDGLQLAYEQARAAFVPGGINRVLIASDGDFNVGPSDSASLKALISTERKSGITLTTLGVGQGTSGDTTMETLADAGDGNSAFLSDDVEARKVLHDELTSTLQTIAKDVKAQVEFNPAVVQSYRLIGYENRRLAERDFDDDAVDAGDIGAGHQVTALYEIQPVASGVAARRRYAANRTDADDAAPAVTGGEALFVKLRYKLPQGGSSILIQQPLPASTLAAAGTPTGDTAFALSVASFGQYLARSPDIAGFSPQDMQRLAGRQTNPERAEFVRLLSMLPGALPVSALPMATPEPSRTQPQPPSYQPQTEEEDGGPSALAYAFLLAGLAGVAAAIWYWLLRHRHTNPTSGTENREGHDRREELRMPGERLAESIRLARTESTDPQTDRSLSILSHVGERAKAAAGSDPDIEHEVRTILDRHLPSYVDEYLQARRRASASRASEIEEALRRTVDMMADRLRSLLDSQTRRDVDRLNDHERFLAGRHVPDAAE